MRPSPYINTQETKIGIRPKVGDHLHPPPITNREARRGLSPKVPVPCRTGQVLPWPEATAEEAESLFSSPSSAVPTAPEQGPKGHQKDPSTPEVPAAEQQSEKTKEKPISKFP